jgi:RNA polymerase sigma factor (sigma-70 family)
MLVGFGLFDAYHWPSTTAVVEGGSVEKQTRLRPSEHTRSLTELVRAAQGDDPGAWNELVERLGNLVWSITRSFGIPAHDAVDVCQTTWLQLARRIDRISDPERLGLWLATTTRRECMVYLARVTGPRRAEPFETLTGRASTAPPIEDTIVEREESRRLWNAVQKLPAGCRGLIRLFLADPEPSYAEVAAALDMPVNSVGPRRRRCLDKLRSSIGV